MKALAGAADVASAIAETAVAMAVAMKRSIGGSPLASCWLCAYTVCTGQTVAQGSGLDMAISKIRGIRVEDELWQAVQEVAAAQRETVAAVVRRGLLAYCREHGREVQPPR